MTQRYQSKTPLLRMSAALAAILITLTLGAFIDMLAEHHVPNAVQAAAWATTASA